MPWFLHQPPQLVNHDTTARRLMTWQHGQLNRKLWWYLLGNHRADCNYISIRIWNEDLSRRHFDHAKVRPTSAVHTHETRNVPKLVLHTSEIPLPLSHTFGFPDWVWIHFWACLRARTKQEVRRHGCFKLALVDRRSFRLRKEIIGMNVEYDDGQLMPSWYATASRDEGVLYILSTHYPLSMMGCRLSLFPLLMGLRGGVNHHGLRRRNVTRYTTC